MPKTSPAVVARGLDVPLETALEIEAEAFGTHVIELALHDAQELVTRAENTLKTLILPDRADPTWSRAIHPATPETIPA